MKILKDNKIYVQKNDMAYLNSSDLPIPGSIFMKVFGQGITIIDDSNRYEFIEFTKPEEVEFFRSLDWIVDYDSVKDLTEEEIIELGQSVAAERNNRAKKFNAMSEAKRKQQYASVMAELELLDFKMYTLRDIIMFKNGELEFTLPDGVERPSAVTLEPTEPVQEKIPTPQKEESGIKKFIKRFQKSPKEK